MKKDYKWELLKGSYNTICPQCGQKRFKPYVSTADGKTPADETKYGRCNREQNCGYNCYPGKDVKIADVKPIVREPDPPLLFSQAAVQVSYNTPLFEFAASQIGRDNAKALWDMYRVGADGKRAVFWEISKGGEVRAGKSIPYKADGHRDKKDPHPTGWCHYSRTYEGLHQGKEMHQCFFGEHLLNESNKIVAIVESEKTAVLMSYFYKGFTWLAAGGSQGLKNESKLKVLEGRKVLLVPDHGQYASWALTAQQHYFHIFRFTDLYPIFEGCDVLDYFV